MNILITSVGRRSYLVKYFKDALKGIGKIFVANSSLLSPAFKEADGSIVTPLIYDSEYVPFLISYCKKKDIKAVISVFDIDLPILAKNKDEFLKEGINVIVSDFDVIEICNDKYLTYKFLRENNFNTPSVFLTVDEALLQIQNNQLSYPLVVKPRWGMGSIGIYIAENEEELKVFYRKTKKAISDSYLKYESIQNIDRDVLIQEMIKGQEYGLDIINNLNGEYQNTVSKVKYAMRAGETDCAMTLDDEKLKEVGKRLSHSLKHIGNLDVDVFMDNENIYILEMNARFGGGYPFSHAAGVDLPKAIVNWLSGIENNLNLLKAKSNIMFQKDIILVPMDVEENKHEK